MTNWNGNGGGWGGDAPVFDTYFEYDWGGRRWPYPDVWITYQRDMPTATRTGRDCIWHYTPDQDDDGWEALGYGGDYYDEGMSCVDDDEHEKRVMCFQAAELLYLHAAAKGNPIADLCLGYVYAYDRCEDKYWEKLTGWQTDEDLRTPFDCDGHAYRHFRRAAEAGVGEACYKLGDMFRDGRGCEVDLAQAFEWFSKAYELTKDDRPHLWGSAALRLGAAFEEGEGCDHSFEKAEHWYKIATTGLGAEVRAVTCGNMTLKVGLLIGGAVSGIVTRTYTEPAPVVKTTINIYVNTDKVGWTAVNFWSWGGDDSHSPVNKNWPGDKVSTTTAIGGKQWYAKEFTINGSDDFVNLVFSTGSGSPQTVDINNVTTTKFYEVSTQKDGDKHLVTDVTGSYTDIREVRGNMADGSNDIYDLQGRKVTQMQRGIYIINGKKVVIK